MESMKSIASEVEDFLEYCKSERKLDPKTIKAYKIDIQQFVGFLNSQIDTTSLLLIEKDTIREYIKHLNQSLRPKSVKRKIATLKSLYSFFEQMDDNVQSPLHKIRLKIQEQKQLPRTITTKEIKKIFQHIYELKSKQDPFSYRYFITLRDIITIEFLFISGVRVSELSNLTIHDISENFDTIRIIGKGKRERIIPIYNSSICSELKEYLKLRSTNNDFLLQNRYMNQFSSQSIRFMVRKHVQDIGLKKHITPHMFRHTVATLLLENNLDIRYIQHLLGHSSISTTEIYTHVTAQSYKTQLSRKHPRKAFMNKG